MSVRASSLPVTAEIRSQKIQSYTITISGGRRRALWTRTTLESGYWICFVRDHDQVHSSGCGQLSTDLLAHLGFKRIVPCCFHNKRIVPCCFHNKRMRLKTRTYGILFLWTYSSGQKSFCCVAELRPYNHYTITIDKLC